MRTAVAISVLAFALLAAGLFVTQASNWHVIGGSDNAFLAECLDNIAERGLPYTSVNRASHRYITLLHDFAEIDDFSDAVAPAPPHEINQFHRHSYVALYLLAPFTKWFDPAMVLTAAKTLSLTALVALGFVLLLRRSGRPWHALAFAALVVAHPFFMHCLSWQVYVDFLFLPAGFLLCIGLRTRPGSWSTLLLALLCCLVCEKFIFVTALLTGTFALLFHRGRTRRSMVYAAGGLLVLFLVVSRTARWIEPDYSVRPHYQYGTWLEILLSAGSLRNSATLLFVSFAVYVPLLLRDRRLIALLLVALLPNLLGSVGGAEKIGWPTHYHITYFPVLAFALYEALALRARDGGARSTAGALAFGSGLLLATCHPLVVDVRNVPDGWQTSTSSQWFVLQCAEVQQRHAASEPTLAHLRALAEKVPAGSRLSVSANLATTLYPGRSLDFFPIGIEQADLLVLYATDYRRDERGVSLVLPPFSTDEQANRRFARFVQERSSERFDLDRPEAFGPWLLFSRRTD
jgi:hypothetical protein